MNDNERDQGGRSRAATGGDDVALIPMPVRR
jgi:hypothetical protein